MNTKNKIATYLAFSALLFSSCEDSLLRPPKDFLSPSVFESEKDIANALNGTYKALTGMNLTGVDGQNVEPILTDFIVDNGFIDKSWMGVLEFWEGGQNQFSQFAEKKWARNYVGVLRANTVLTYLPKVDMALEKRKQYDAQARFLRAYFYSDLIQFYGDVPFRTKPEGIEAKDKARTPKAEIVDFIYEELDSAMTVLPGRLDTDFGRATKGAAKALKAWVALNNGDYDITIDMCDDIIQDGEYSIYPDYANLFKPEFENNQEVIFDIQYMMDKTVEKLTEPFTTYFYAWSSCMADYSLASSYYMKDGSPADETSDTFNPLKPFENRDPRLGATLAIPYAFNGYMDNGDFNYNITYLKRAYNFTSLRINKYVDYNVEHGMRGKKSTGTNVILFRYADILLMKAEALCMTKGAAADAEIRNLVDQVRQRPSVMMPKVEDVEGTGLDQEQLMDIIKHERRVEFAFEGTRIVDVARWDIGAEVYTQAKGYDPNYLYYWVVNKAAYDKIEEEAILPSSYLRYLKSTSYFYNKVFKSEAAFQEQMENVFAKPSFELEKYGPILIEYVQPRYEVYSYRERSFNASKGYLWPIPYNEITTNDLINTNNPGY